MVTLDAMVRTPSSWLDGTGPHAGIVLSSRLRLARNLARIPFPARARKDQLTGERPTWLRLPWMRRSSGWSGSTKLS